MRGGPRVGIRVGMSGGVFCEGVIMRDEDRLRGVGCEDECVVARGGVDGAGEHIAVIERIDYDYGRMDDGGH